VLISNHGDVKLIDFGVAKDEKPSKLTVTGMIVGTPSYMSPEQANGDPLGIQSDIYSLGVLLYEMVTGTKPFPGETNTEILMKIVKGRYPSPRRYNHELPHGLVRIIRKALRRDIDRRYQNASELIRDLSRFIPWQKQIHRKEIIGQFLNRFKQESRTQTTTQLYTPVAFNTISRTFIATVILLSTLTIFAGYQMRRFLVNERYGQIDVATNSAAVTLVINGNKRREIRQKMASIGNLAPGRYTLSVFGNDGNGVYETNIRLKPAEKLQINAVLPHPEARARIRITSYPSGARVFDRDQYIGTTPLDSAFLEQGPHLIRIQSDHYLPYERSFRLERGQSYNLHFNLEPEK
jgi:serine/threonine protein kinase